MLINGSDVVSQGLESRSILLTGGTGFVGQSIRDALTDVPNIQLFYTGSRGPSGSRGAHEEFVKWEIGQPINCPMCDMVIHAATPASSVLNRDNPLRMFRLIVEGVSSVIELAERWGNSPRVLFTSSGAVYGPMPSELERFDETCLVAPDPHTPESAYGEGKRVAEMMLAEASHRNVLRPVYCRLFAFSGSYLPLDRHFAIGNFVRDAVLSNTIKMTGSGSAVRSYLDQADLAQWCIAALSVGATNSTYHIGSERPISILELARLVASRTEMLFSKTVEIVRNDNTQVAELRNRYVPDTARTRSSLGVQETVRLEESVDLMLRAASRLISPGI